MELVWPILFCMKNLDSYGKQKATEWELLCSLELTHSLKKERMWAEALYNREEIFPKPVDMLEKR